MLLALLSAIGYSAEEIIDKYVLSVKGINYAKFLALYGIIAIPLALFALYFFSSIDLNLITFSVLLVFLAIILVAFLSDVTYLHGLELDDLSESVPITNFSFLTISFIRSRPASILKV